MADDPQLIAAVHTYVQETAPVLVLHLDADLRVVGGNAQARHLLGDEALSRPLADLIVDFRQTLDLPALILQVDAVHPLTISTASGLPETLAFRFFPLTSGVLALASFDFKEQAKLRNETLRLNRELNGLSRILHQANAELRELNQLKNHFIGMAAHDLRNSLGAVAAFNELVLEGAGPALSARHRDYLATSLTAAGEMLALIEGFLDLTVIESGNLRLKRTPATAAEILGGAEPIARFHAEKKRIDLLTYVSDGDTRRWQVDVGKCQQVLLNLIRNGVEHSQPGQSVWVSSLSLDRELVFTVRDEGHGIAPEDQAGLFTAFGQASSPKTAGERSTGLGLAIARLIVEAHGGRIWVKSVPGQGATFSFTLPAVSEE